VKPERNTGPQLRGQGLRFTIPFTWRDRFCLPDIQRLVFLAGNSNPRVIIATGFALTSFGLFPITHVYLGVSFNTMLTYRII
jgi:hypothetical protein